MIRCTSSNPLYAKYIINANVTYCRGVNNYPNVCVCVCELTAISVCFAAGHVLG